MRLEREVQIVGLHSLRSEKESEGWIVTYIWQGSNVPCTLRNLKKAHSASEIRRKGRIDKTLQRS